MNKEQLDETFGGIVDNKFDTVIGKIVEKDEKYVFEGVSLNKKGQVIGSITYVAGLFTLTYLGAKAGAKLGEKIANKIHQRKLRKAKAEAFDEMVDILEEAKKELQEKHSQELEMSEKMENEWKSNITNIKESK